MNVLYRDLGDGSSVTATLVRSSLINNGGTATVVSFSSEAFAQGTALQKNTVSTCSHAFDFEWNAYHIEVTLTRATASTSTPLLRAIQLTSVPCID